jgi:GNAT superfamily N-acetyltransferase
MIRSATAADLPRIFEIRDSIGDTWFTDPAAVTASDAAWFIANGPVWVWQEPGSAIAGFAAGDPRDGTVWALFVAHSQDGKGIGRALLKAACDSLRQAGHTAARLSTKPGSVAERHFRAAGWSVVGYIEKGEVVFQKPL